MNSLLGLSDQHIKPTKNNTLFVAFHIRNISFIRKKKGIETISVYVLEICYLFNVINYFMYEFLYFIKWG